MTAAEHDILSALIAWVEEDRAPETITAAAYVDDNSEKGIAFTRPLCMVSVERE